MVAAAREVHAIVDHTKWGRVASASFCRADRLSGVITDRDAPSDVVEELRTTGVAVTIAREVGQ
jgi:DeoR/GlpR family transcriptional regulator of sugar metabolism